MNKTDHNKIYAVLIVCIAIIVSVFLLIREPNVKSLAQNSAGLNNSSEEKPIINGVEDEDKDWQNLILKSNLDKYSTSSSKIALGPNDFDSSLVTARMARDLFSKYLETSKNGQTLSPQDVNNIVNSTISDPNYSQINSVVYVESNLKISGDNTTYGYKKYNLIFNQKLANRFSEIQNLNDPISIMLKTAEKDDPKMVSQLDPIISATQGLVNDLLSINVPSRLVHLHLDVINSVSSLLSDIQAMRKIYSDPVASLIATNQYNKHMSEFLNSLAKIKVFFEKI